MKQFIYGFLCMLVLVIVSGTVYYFTREIPEEQGDNEALVDTVYTEIIRNYTIKEKDKISYITYITQDSSEYVAVYDTTIVTDKVTANIKTAFSHPQKLFDFEADFKVKTDSVYVYKEVTKIKPYKFIRPTVDIGVLRREDFMVLGLGVGASFKGHLGVILRAQTDLSYGLGVSYTY